jgi:putative heme-binding domain-containing protein
MRIHASMRLAVIVLLAVGARLDAEEKPNPQQAMDTLQKLGARCQVDASLPGRPVVAVDLDHSDVHGDTLKLLKMFPHLHTVRWREGWSIVQEDMKLLGSLTQLRKLDIWAWHIQDDWLEHLEGLTNLESLTLFWGEEFTDEGLRPLRRLTTLRTLNLPNGINITDKGLAHLRGLTNLRQLNLGGTKISGDGLAHLKGLCNLETLGLGATKIGDKGLAYLKEMSALQSLDLGHSRVTDKGLEHLKELKDLRSLNLDAQDIRGDGLKHLKHLPQLRTLRLGANIQGKNLPLLKGLIHLRELAFASARFEDKDWEHLGELTSLQSLEIDRARFTTDEGLEQFRKLTRLRRLKLGHSEQMTDRSLEHLKGMANLQDLQLSVLPNISDAGLEHLKGLANLQELRLTELDNVSGAGLQQLKGLTELQSLALRALPVADKDLEIVMGFQKLHTLSVSNRGVTDEFLKHLQRLPNIRELNISYTCVSDAGMVYLADLTNLHTLDIANTSITNRGLGHLKAQHNLKTICVEDTNVTDEGVASFRQSRPGTKVIQYTLKQTAYVPGRERREPLTPSRRLLPLVRILDSSDDESEQLDVLRGMHEALQGRRTVTAPEGWSEVYRKLAESKNAEVREKVLQLSVLFGDPQALAALRKTAADPKADVTARRNALQTLIEKRPADLPPLLRELVRDRVLRGLALRGLASYSDAETPALILEHYGSFSDAEKADAIATLTSRPKYALALLDAMEKGRVPRRDLSAFTVRQLLTFNDKNLADRLTKVWGSIRAPSQEKAAQLAKYKAMVPPDVLKKADRKHGRLLFARTCANCHTLFGEGGKIGPDLTGSQRTNPEYLLTKLIDPSAVVARDYQMTVITTKSGRTISGLVKEESNKTLALQTQNEVVRLEKSDIEERSRSAQSMMPDGLLAMLSPTDVRNLIAYLSGSGQVALPPSALEQRK